MSMSDQAAVIAFLSRPETFGPAVTSVERHETHGSIVFLAGDLAYKLKRAVRYPYMDYSTRELRRRMCEKELEVNRRTAADLYIEVRPIVATHSDGLRWGGPGEEREAIDWVVVMRRFAQSELLEEMRKAGRLTPALMRVLAERIASFHAAAQTKPATGGAAGLAGVVNENIAILSGMAGRPFPAEAVAKLSRRSRLALGRVAALLDRRRKNGFVRACHGDLHLNNVCLVGGVPLLFDAIEFNDAFSNIDVFYDLAFLLMDLGRHGRGELANTVLNRYLELTWDHGALPALPLFLSCRAAVRAHVTMSRTDAASRARRDEALGLLQAALTSLAPCDPQLVAIGGASGTGKSTLAYALAPTLPPSPGAITIRSDLIRKRLLGVDETTNLPPSAYTPEVSERVYATMAQLTGEVLRAGYSVVVDAVFGEPAHRHQIEAVAQSCGRRITAFWLEAPQEELLARVAGRRADASDATVEVLRHQLETVRAPDSWTRLSASGAPAHCARLAQNILNSAAKLDVAQVRS